MDLKDKVVVWLYGAVKSPPFSAESRQEAGLLLRRLQNGEKLSMPQSRPMPSVGRRYHELRITDNNSIWRIIYRIDPDAIIILEVFGKKTNTTPDSVINVCKDRLRDYDNATS